MNTIATFGWPHWLAVALLTIPIFVAIRTAKGLPLLPDNVDWSKAWNHGGSMFATFWIVIALYALGAYLVWAFLQLDAQFSRPLAGGVIPANVTQQIAWGIRAFSVIAGSLAIYFAAHKMRGWSRWFSGLTVFAAILLLVHAFGVSAKIMQKQYTAVSSISEVASVDVGSIDEELADLISERDALPALTQTTIDTYQRSIDSITNDGLDNDDQAVLLAEKQSQAVVDRDARLAEIRSRMQELRSEKRGVQTAEVQENAVSSSFNDLFIFGARFSTNTWNPAEDPPDTHKFIWGVAFFTFWFGFGEILMMASFTGGYAVLKLRSVQQMDQSVDPVRSEAAKKGHETKRRRKRQTLKIQEQADSYLPAWKKAVQYATNTKWTAKGISDTAFPNVSIDHVIEVLRKANKDGKWKPELEEEINLVKRLVEPPTPAEDKRYAVEIIDPDPSSLNGSAQIDGEDDDDAEPSRV